MSRPESDPRPYFWSAVVPLNVIYHNLTSPLTTEGFDPVGVVQTLSQETHQHFEHIQKKKKNSLHFQMPRENNTVYQYFSPVTIAKFVQADLQTASCDGLQDVNTRAN